jgi:hypothetical protein
MGAEWARQKCLAETNMPGKSGDKNVVVNAEAVGKAAGKATGAVHQAPSGGEPASTSGAVAKTRYGGREAAEKGKPISAASIEMKRAQKEMQSGA